MASEQKFKIINIAPLPDSEVEIEVELAEKAVSEFRAKALAGFQESISLPGFRKGHVPEKLLAEKVGEMMILEECVELALAEYYLDIIKESKKNVIGAPKAAITKLAPGNDVVMKITVAEVPEITLPDYKAFSKEVMVKKEKVEVEEKEVDDAITEIRKRMAVKTSSIDPETKKENEVEELPEITDDFVTKIGDFKNVVDFRAKLEESILKEKEMRESEKSRLEIMEKILGAANISVPKILIDSELDRMMAQFADNIESMGIKKDEYMKQVGKSEESLREEWKDEALKRAKIQLILNNIISTEKLQPEVEDVKKEVEHLVSHYKDVDPLRVEAYVETMLANEKAWKLLEGNSK